MNCGRRIYRRPRMRARNTAVFCHEAEAMLPESLTSCAAYCTYPSFFTWGLHFHSYTGLFLSRGKPALKLGRSSRSLYCVLDESLGKDEAPFKLARLVAGREGFVDSTLISIFPKWSLTEGRSRKPSRGLAPRKSPLAGVWLVSDWLCCVLVSPCECGMVANVRPSFLRYGVE
jgi:hypothetical protein